MFELTLLTCGIAVVVLVWLSVVRTTLVARPSSSRMARWTVRMCAVVATAVARRMPARARAWVMDFCAPVSLFVMVVGWLAGLAVGFGLLLVALGEPRQDASSFGFAMNGAAVALVIAATTSAVLVAAAFAAHLVHVMDAYRRREGMVARSATQVQRVADADALLATYLRSGSRESLDGYFAQWADWLADVRLSHDSYPGLVYCRPTGLLSWSMAAVVVLDAAALVEAAAPKWAPLHTRVLLDVGSGCLQRVARQIGIQLPRMTVSLQEREEREFGDTMQFVADSGLPVEQDIDCAWLDFQRIRVRYAPYAVLIGSRLLRS
jgi:hypothetical protein